MSHLPDGQNATGLGKAGLFLNTANSLLENGRDLRWSSLGLSVRSDLLQRSRSRADLQVLNPSSA